ncbi:SdpI family protein [Nonomuraea sp. NPDC004702]
MKPEQVIVSAVLMAASIAALALGILGRLGRLKRNGLFGVRTRRSMSSDEAWRYVHLRFAPFVWAVAFCWAIAAIIPFLVNSPTGMGPPVLIGIVLGLTSLVAGAIWAHRGLG